MAEPAIDAVASARPTSILHRRTIEFEVTELDTDTGGSGDFEVVARLRDERPWAEGTDMVSRVHDMELRVRVRRPDLTIVAAQAEMGTFPHAECPGIEAAFGHLVGLSVGRGYSRAVQERFGRALGCTHLEFLARAIGPVVVQALPSAAARAGGTLDGAATAWLTDTCHVWAAGGPGSQKLELGWRPGRGQYPAPSVADLKAEAGS